MKKISLLFLALSLILVFSGCDKEPKTGDILLEIFYDVDGDAVNLNSMEYTNAASNQFSVTKLQYYISGIKLTDNNGDVFEDNGVYFVDYEVSASSEILIPNVPVGTYTKLELILGVEDEKNVDGGLEATAENNGMIWPTPMGGGYHHMKLEGYYRDSIGDTIGYGMHLGRNGYQPTNTVTGLSLEVVGSAENHQHVNYDINEWHQNPANWNFDLDGVSIMGDLTAQQKLSDNGNDIISK